MHRVVVTGGPVLTMVGEGVGYLADGAVAIEGSTIVEVGSRDEIGQPSGEVQVIDVDGGLIMPGLIDCHIHSATTVARGLAQEVTAWMGSAYGPLIRHARDEDAELWSMVALMEGVAAGTTTFGDYEAPMDQVLESHLAMGNRAVVCQGVTGIDWTRREEWMKSGWKPGDPAILDDAVGQQGLEAEIALYERWHGAGDGRISVIFGPLAADMLSESLLKQTQDVARARASRIHLHVAQDPRENRATMDRAGLRAIPYLDSIGLLAPDTIAVHLSTATDEEIALVARRGAAMACCTNSIGIIDGVVPPARKFADMGGVVGLGSDQAAGNNSHNIFAEMRATAMFAKIATGDPLALPAWQVLRMATIGGARVLGIDDQVGTLEPGKAADLIVVDTRRPPLLPVILHPARNLAANLVYGETGANVRLTMVAGRVIYRDGRFTQIDEAAIVERVREASSRFEQAASADPAVAALPIVELTHRGLI